MTPESHFDAFRAMLSEMGWSQRQSWNEGASLGNDTTAARSLGHSSAFGPSGVRIQPSHPVVEGLGGHFRVLAESRDCRAAGSKLSESTFPQLPLSFIQTTSHGGAFRARVRAIHNGLAKPYPRISARAGLKSYGAGGRLRWALAASNQTTVFRDLVPRPRANVRHPLRSNRQQCANCSRSHPPVDLSGSPVPSERHIDRHRLR